MTISNLFRFACFKQLVARILADGFRQTIACFFGFLLHRNQGFVHEMCEQIKHIIAKSITTYHLYSLKCPTSGKDRQTMQEHTFRLR